MTTEYDSPEQLVRTVMLSSVKARSNMAEHDLDDVGEFLFPNIYEERWDNVITVCERLLSDGRVPTGSDAANLMFLVHRSPELVHLLNAVPMLQGMEPLPEPMDVLERWATVGL